MCQHHICKQNRAIHINSNKVAEFICQHLEKIPDSTTPLNIFDKLRGGDNIYPCDESTMASLNSLAAECDAMGFPVAVHVSPSMYCVFGRATATNATGYSHVRVTDTEIRCCSKDCRSSMVRAKQQKARRICSHIHVLLSVGILKDLETADSLLEEVASLPDSTILGTGNNEENLTKSRKATIDLKMKRTLPYQIPLAIIKQAGKWMHIHQGGNRRLNLNRKSVNFVMVN